MAQPKRPVRYRSPPPLKIPALPNPIRFQPNGLKGSPRQAEPTATPSIPANSQTNSQFFEKSSFSINPAWNQERINSVLNRPKMSNGAQPLIVHHPDADENPLVLDKNHLPVHGRFPFDVPPVPTTMETHVEDNVHKLRLRLIDSELNHQRRSTDEYIKRTHRLAMEPDVQNIAEIERDLEIRQIQDSLNSARRAKPTLKISNYSYDARIHLYPLNEDQQYVSSNMDDLIDSMARRHLAHRRLDAAIEHQRRSGSLRSGYADPLGTPRSSRLTPRSQVERDYARINQAGFHHMLRTRIEYYTRLQNDMDDLEPDEIFRANSYAKLPPISSAHQPLQLQQPSNMITVASASSRYPPPLVPNPSEHLIELPSDIFLASRADAILSSNRSRKVPMRTFSKETREGIDLSEGDNDLSTIRRQASEQEKTSQDGDPAGFFTDTAANDQPDRSRDIRNLFPKVAMGVLFLITLRRRAAKTRATRKTPSPSAAIHKIRLQEIIVALHRVYLEPDGPIYNVLIQAINHPIPFAEGFNRSSKNYEAAIDAIGDALKTLVARIVDFMPKDGIVGTGKTSAVSILLQDGNPFPTNYFWDCEKEHLEFNGTRVININRKRSVILLIGIFIFRALVTTLLIKPIKYRLILGRLSANQASNLKVLASIVLLVARRAAGRKKQSLAMPHEWQLSLFNDETMKTISEHAEMQEILANCQQSLREWCEEYIRRIDVSHGKELRM